jgi:hypothetical protein
MYRIQIFTARAICLKTLGLLAGLAGTLALAACEAGPSVVSLKEAKQITAKFSGSFTPPPRTINDITAVLDEQQRADPEAAERARAAAYRDPPPDADSVPTRRPPRGRARRPIAIHPPTPTDKTSPSSTGSVAWRPASSATSNNKSRI